MNGEPSIPAISVIIPCRNEARHIEECLRSILAQEPVEGGFEVIVVDGASEDGTRDVLTRMAQTDARMRILDNPQRITPCAMNIGIQNANGRWICIMGAHQRYAPDYLSECLKVAQKTGADNVGGAMFLEPHGYMQRAIAAAHHSAFAVGGARWHNTDYEGPADTVFGGFYPRTVFDRIGYFDEELVRNQDDELNLRLTRAGGKIWQSPRIKSWYTPRGSLTALFRQYFQYGYWKVRVIQKHKLPASPRHLVPGVFVLGLALGWLAGFVHWSLWVVYAGTVACYAALSLVFSALAAMGRRESEPQSGRAPEPQSDRGQKSEDGPRASSPAIAAKILNAEGRTAERRDQNSEVSGQNGRAAGLSASGGRDARAPGRNWDLLPVLPFVFFTYHLAYGMGFLLGLWDFVIRRKGGRAGMAKLTRS